jgi:hypothetical protein
MISLERLYRASWTGRRRRAWTVERGDIKFAAEFQRWIARKMKKEGLMILKREIESEHLKILIFRKDDCEKSMVRYVAETIIALGDDPAGVPSAAIHYAIPGHPFTGTKRFYEITAAYRRQWTGMEELYVKESHTFKSNHYYFSQLFMAWLRTNLPEIERVVYPVTIKKRFHDEKS